MFILGILLFLILIWASLVFAGGPAHVISVWDAPSFIFLFLGYFAIMAATNSYKDFAYGIKAVFSKKFTGEKKSLKQAARFFALLNRVSIPIGVLAFIIGGINYTIRLDEPNMLFPSMVVATLALFYAIIVKLVFLMPAEYILNKKASGK